MLVAPATITQVTIVSLLSTLHRVSCLTSLSGSMLHDQQYCRNGLFAWHRNLTQEMEPLDPEIAIRRAGMSASVWNWTWSHKGGIISENHPDLAGELMDFFQKEEWS